MKTNEERTANKRLMYAIQVFINAVEEALKPSYTPTIENEGSTIKPLDEVLEEKGTLTDLVRRTHNLNTQPATPKFPSREEFTEKVFELIRDEELDVDELYDWLISRMKERIEL